MIINSEARMTMYFPCQFETMTDIEESPQVALVSKLAEDYPDDGYLGMELLLTDSKKYAGIIIYFDSDETRSNFKEWNKANNAETVAEFLASVTITRGLIDGFEDFALYINLLD